MIENYLPYKEPGKCDQFLREMVINRCQPEKTQTLELSGTDDEATIITVLIRHNTFEVNGMIEILSRQIQTIKKNQVEILEQYKL